MNIKKIDAHAHVTYRKLVGSDIKFNPPEKFLEVMKENSITKSVIVPINYPYYHAKKISEQDFLKTLRLNNDYQAKIAKTSKRFICFADIDLYALSIKDNIDELNRAIYDLKLKGIKIHPFNQGTKLNDKKVIEVMRFAKQGDLPVIIHSFRKKNDRRTSCSSPKYIKELLSKTKHHRVLVSHMGGVDYRMLKKIDCWFDFSFAGTPLWNELGHVKLEKIMRELGIDRCCFASDYSAMKYSNYYDYLNKMTFTDDEIERISFKNASRFLNISNH